MSGSQVTVGPLLPLEGIMVSGNITGFKERDGHSCGLEPGFHLPLWARLKSRAAQRAEATLSIR